MIRFSLKDVIRGMTLIAIGTGMLGMASHLAKERATTEHIFLVAFGGVLIGYGLAFPIKYPPTQMLIGMAGMFGAEAWDEGSAFGLIFYFGILVVTGALGYAKHLKVTRKGLRDVQPAREPADGPWP